MTGDDLDPYLGRAFIGDGVGTVLAALVGGSPDHHLRREHRRDGRDPGLLDAAYYIAAVVAILFGFCPKFGALVAATPGGVLGGITVVLYGMIGLLGAKIWIENRVDFANPVNLVPLGRGHHRRHRQPGESEFTETSRSQGIAARHHHRADRLPRAARAVARQPHAVADVVGPGRCRRVPADAAGRRDRAGPGSGRREADR